MSVEENDPDATVWQAVSELEKKKFTKREIHLALRQAAESLRPEDGFKY